MTVTQLRDLMVPQVNNVPPSDADYTDETARFLQAVYEVVARIRSEHLFWFKYDSDTVTVTANAKAVALPDNFEEMGMFGQVILSATGKPLDYVEPDEMLAIQNESGYSTTEPGVYSIFGIEDNSDDSDVVPAIQIPTNPGAVALRVQGFQTRILDMDLTTNNDKLKLNVPGTYHRTVVWPGVRARMERNRGDSRWDQDPAFQVALANMRRTCRSYRAPGQAPSFFGGC